MKTRGELLLVHTYANEILELIERQVRNDADSLTQSDLQGVVDAMVMRILAERDTVRT